MSEFWKPSVTVAAIIERDGRYLLVEEETPDGLKLNQPAGHLDPGETLVAACARETLEETAHRFTPTHLVGVYLNRYASPRVSMPATYLRFTFCGEIGAREADRALDHGIVRTLWLTYDELIAREHDHRSPIVRRCVDDYRRGQRAGLDLLFAHPSALDLA